MELITIQNYSTLYLGTGDVLYLATNNTHYILTYVSGSEIRMRTMLYGLGNYGAEIITDRRGLVGMCLIMGGAG